VAIAGIDARKPSIHGRFVRDTEGCVRPDVLGTFKENYGPVSILAGLNRRMGEARGTGSEIRHDGKGTRLTRFETARNSAFVQPRSPNVQSHDLTKLRVTPTQNAT
jgi:hypothetical protein